MATVFYIDQLCSTCCSRNYGLWRVCKLRIDT